MIKYIIQDELAGMPLPGRYNNLEEDLQMIISHGFSVIISLFDNSKEEEKLFAKMDLSKFSIEHYSMEFPDYSIPKKDEAWKIIKLIDKKIKNEKKKVLIHCGAGAGRTGTIIALYLKSKKESLTKNSIKTVREIYNEDAIETIEQEIFIKKWNNSLKNPKFENIH